MRSPFAASYVNAPPMPDVPLNGEQAATGAGASGSVGEFSVAVPLIVPRFTIVVPAITFPLTTASFFSVTDDCG